MARAYVQDGYVNKFRPTIRAEHSITDVEIYTFNSSGKRSLVGKMLVKGFSDMNLRLVLKQFYNALTGKIIDKD